MKLHDHQPPRPRSAPPPAFRPEPLNLDTYQYARDVFRRSGAEPHDRYSKRRCPRRASAPHDLAALRAAPPRAHMEMR